ncbi:MAG: hypothetical protein LBK47_06860 [Prevotellaceae bacterium]|jgi:hypothetical protein|nr:hypothetical protein [Prevotellaceae bacterium]
MAYTLQSTVNNLAIAEQEYAKEAFGVRFTKFTSCIGVVGQSSKGLTGVHLVILSKDDQRIQEADIPQVADLLKSSTRIVVFGHVGTWKSDDELAKVYDKLLLELKRLVGEKMLYEIDLNDGIYGADTADGHLKIYQYNPTNESKRLIKMY